MFAGLVICAFLLGAAWPVLSSLASVPPQVLTSDVYALTQGTGPQSINESLVQSLSAQPWVELVEGEILAAGTLGGAPVVVRGANASVFVAMEGGTWVAQTSAPDHWAVAGSGLQARAGLSLGRYVTLEGSSNPALDVVPVVGFFRSSTLANEFAEATTKTYTSALIALGLILFLITFIVLAIAKLLLLRLAAREGGKT